MRSKTSLFNGKLFKDALRRYWGFGFVAFMTALFSVPVWLSAMLRNNQSMVSYNPEPLRKLLSGFFFRQPQYLSPDLFIAMVFGAAAGIVFFGYVHNKKQVDFYHSQPVTRDALLFTRFLAGLALYAAAYLINLLFAYFLLLGNGASAAIFGDLVLRFLVVMLGFCMLYAFSILCAAVTGSSFAHLQVGFVLSFGGSLVLLCLIWLSCTFLKTFSTPGGESTFWASAPLHFFYRVNDGSLTLPCLAYYVAATAGALVLARIAYRKRPSESAGCMLVYRPTEPVFRAIVSALFCFLFASVLHSINEEPGFLIFGALMGAFLGHLFCQGQFQRSFARMFTAWKPFIALCAVLTVLFCAFALDVTRFDQYVPDEAEVASAAVRINQDDSVRYYYNSTADALDQAASSDPGYIRDARGMAVAGVASIGADIENTYTYMYTIRYKLLNGRTVERLYNSVPAKAVAQSMAELVEQPDYIARNKVFDIDPALCIYVNVTTSGDAGSYYATSAAERARFVTALQQDVREHGAPADIASNVYAQVGYTPSGTDAGAAQMALPVGMKAEAEQESEQFNIYDSYTNTLAVLQDWGASSAIYSQAQLDEASRLAIVNDFGREGENILFETSNKARMAEILNSGALTSYSGSLTLREPYSVILYTDSADGANAEEKAVEYSAFGGDAQYYYAIMLDGWDKLGVRP